MLTQLVEKTTGKRKRIKGKYNDVNCGQNLPFDFFFFFFWVVGAPPATHQKRNEKIYKTREKKSTRAASSSTTGSSNSSSNVVFDSAVYWTRELTASRGIGTLSLSPSVYPGLRQLYTRLYAARDPPAICVSPTKRN